METERVLKLNKEEATEVASTLLYFLNSMLDDEISGHKLRNEEKSSIIVNGQVIDKLVRIYPSIKNDYDFPADIYAKLKKNVVGEDAKKPESQNSRLRAVDNGFRRKSIEELVEEVMAYIKELYKQDRHNRRLINSPSEAHAMIHSVIGDFWNSRYTRQWSGLGWIKQRKVEEAVDERWAELCPGIWEDLPAEQKEMLKKFSEKTSGEQADDLVSLFEKKDQWPALFDRSPQGRRKAVFSKFWAKQLSFLDEKLIDYFIRGSKWWEVKNLVLSRLPEVEKRVYKLVIAEFTKWAKFNNKISVTHAEIRVILKSLGLSDAPKRLENTIFNDLNEMLSRYSVNLSSKSTDKE